MKAIDEDTLRERDDFLNKMAVLTEFNFLDEEKMPLLKARIAKELGEGEIFIT